MKELFFYIHNVYMKFNCQTTNTFSEFYFFSIWWEYRITQQMCFENLKAFNNNNNALWKLPDMRQFHRCHTKAERNFWGQTFQFNFFSFSKTFKLKSHNLQNFYYIENQGFQSNTFTETHWFASTLNLYYLFAIFQSSFVNYNYKY